MDFGPSICIGGICWGIFFNDVGTWVLHCFYRLQTQSSLIAWLFQGLVAFLAFLVKQGSLLHYLCTAMWWLAATWEVGMKIPCSSRTQKAGRVTSCTERFVVVSVKLSSAGNRHLSLPHTFLPSFLPLISPAFPFPYFLMEGAWQMCGFTLKLWTLGADFSTNQWPAVELFSVFGVEWPAT